MIAECNIPKSLKTTHNSPVGVHGASLEQVAQDVRQRDEQVVEDGVEFVDLAYACERVKSLRTHAREARQAR